MASGFGQGHPFAHKTPNEAYVYYKMQEDPELASDWGETMNFCETIGDKGKKMLLAALITKKYTAAQIAKEFTYYHFNNKTMPLGMPFRCNDNDIIKADRYLREMNIWPWVIQFNEKNRVLWEDDEKMLSELKSFIVMLEKGIPEEENIDNK